jgi:hypothetical protein
MKAGTMVSKEVRVMILPGPVLDGGIVRAPERITPSRVRGSTAVSVARAPGRRG